MNWFGLTKRDVMPILMITALAAAVGGSSLAELITMPLPPFSLAALVP